jgi:RNA polymerase sigma factor (sigma-70 family)
MRVRGNDMGFEELLDEGLDPLLRFTRALTGDRGLAEDIVRDVLLKLHQRSDRLNEIADVGAYARRMAVNEYLSWGSEVVPGATQRRRAGAGQPPHPDHAAELVVRDDLRRRLANLPRKQRAVLVLRYYAGLDDAEVAATLKCRPGTVRSHASRALAALRVELAAADTEEIAS